jgi:hypothetical protein
VDPFSVSTRQDLGIALVAVGTGPPTHGVSVGAARTHVHWDATTWSRQVLDLAELRDKPLCLSVFIVLWLLCFARTPLYPLGFIVLTPNQVLWH